MYDTKICFSIIVIIQKIFLKRNLTILRRQTFMWLNPHLEIFTPSTKLNPHLCSGKCPTPPPTRRVWINLQPPLHQGGGGGGGEKLCWSCWIWREEYHEKRFCILCLVNLIKKTLFYKYGDLFLRVWRTLKTVCHERGQVS